MSASEAHQGRTTISLRTAFTPLVSRARRSASTFSVLFFAKPERMTSPFSVWTLMEVAPTG